MSRYWREAGSHVTALDLSVEMLAPGSATSARIVILQGILRSLPLADACVDLA